MTNISKFLACFLVLMLIKNYSFCQSDKHQYDKIIKKALERSIDPTTLMDTSGSIILKISKEDSIINITPLFLSDKRINISNVIYLSFLNKYLDLRSKIKAPFKLIVPIYYSYSDIYLVSEKDKQEVAKQLEQLKSNGFVISNEPVYIFQFETITIRDTTMKIDSSSIKK